MRIDDENFWRAVENWRQDNIDYIPQDLMRRALARGRAERSRAIRAVFSGAARSLISLLRAATRTGRESDVAPVAPARTAALAVASGTPLDAGRIKVLRESWAIVEPTADAAMATFYDRLFDMEPSLRGVFRETDMAAQRAKLAAALGHLMEMVDRPDKLVPVLADLGRRHATYGVEPHHYDAVGAALLWTLERGLGSRWTPELSAVWRDTYALVAANMMAGAGPPETPEFRLAA